MSIFEIHAYTKFEKFLAPFTQELNRLKTKFTDCLKDCKSPTAKQTYCDALNQQMQLNNKQALTPKSFTPNHSKRNFYKLAVNSFFGKFSQRTNKGNILFTSSQEEIEKLALNNNIEDIFCVTDRICMVNTCKPNKPLQIPSLKYNVYIGSQITAFARQTIHEHLMSLQCLPHCTLYHVNCDSLFYTLPKTHSNPLLISHSVGHFKHINESEILSYIAFGPRQYCFTYQLEKNLISETHVSGLSIRHELQNFDFETLFHKMQHNLERKIFDQFIVPQSRKRINLKALTFKRYADKFTFNNSLTSRRCLAIETPRLETVAFGYLEIGSRLEI